MRMWGREEKMMMGGGGGAGQVEAMGMGVGGMPPPSSGMSMTMSMPLHMNPAMTHSNMEHHTAAMLHSLVGIGTNNMSALTNMGSSKKDDSRIPQWSSEETKEFIAIRAEFEKDFTQTKRNKTLWELISTRMKEKGYKRSSEQCKCKWKNLVNRYKGKETSDPETGRQCPFFEELDAIFKERAKNMERLLMESETGSTQPKKKLRKLKGLHGDRSSDDYSEDDDEDEEDSEDERALKTKKRKTDRDRQRMTAERSRANNMQEVLQDFFQQQQRIEMQWRESFERREQERRVVEQEWRQAMQKLEQERVMMEQSWREREEQRRLREEGRAEKRDALLNTLLNRLIREE